MKILYIHLLGVFVLGLSGMSVHARVRTKQSVREFDQQLSRSQVVVALFYASERGNRKNVNGRTNIDQLLRMYEKTSSKKLYDDADVTFVKVNVTSDDSEKIVQRYARSQLPFFVLFDNGRIVVDQNQQNAVLAGFVSEHDLHHFIMNYCGERIRAIVDKKEQKRKQRIQDAKNESDPYFYPSVIYTPSGDSSSWVKPLKYTAEGDEK